ncbi:uncharacterized protein MCYG_04766 [Microsporum canis CBS 113480]|uniref:Uncharacterized protein n=1 Tax=Arthroderma otae (strain ATCC MYA-4605 / CBS 113480) TaxID=554155 RepID=C5FPZ4_ARTOC|nr:uncharacterized protein MCYG_04766 [Microsporum canis CBS 113480]EEQ31947.1 predicted protein [Microsporum canis CBS 113480]
MTLAKYTFFLIAVDQAEIAGLGRGWALVQMHGWEKAFWKTSWSLNQAIGRWARELGRMRQILERDDRRSVGRRIRWSYLAREQQMVRAAPGDTYSRGLRSPDLLCRKRVLYVGVTMAENKASGDVMGRPRQTSSKDKSKEGAKAKEAVGACCLCWDVLAPQSAADEGARARMQACGWRGTPWRPRGGPRHAKQAGVLR